MEKKRWRKVVEAVVREMDYDIWKSLFVAQCVEDPEEAEEAVERMIAAAMRASVTSAMKRDDDGEPARARR